MKLKDKVITTIICFIILIVYFIVSKYSVMVNKIDKVFNVYLNGEVIGVINNKEELYNLIDQKQQGIKNKYLVNTVYPPNSLTVLEDYSYDAKIDSVENIYSKSENSDDFTVFGYEVKVTSNNTENKKDFSIYVLEKETFYDALKKFVLAFISEEDYDNYMSGKENELEGLGIIYKEMNILENIIIREKYISTNNTI